MREFKDNEIAYWASVSAGALAPNRFFALDDRAWKKTGKIVVKVNHATGKIGFESPFGVRYVGAWRITPGGQTQSITPAFICRSDKAPREVTVDTAGLKKQLGDMKFKFRVIDDEGLSSTFLLSSLLARAGEEATSKPGK